MSIETTDLIAYANKWADDRICGITKQRVGFKRFLASDSGKALDYEVAKNVYEAITGDSAEYVVNGGHDEVTLSRDKEIFVRVVRLMSKRINNTPQSASDIIGFTDRDGVYRTVRNFLQDAARDGVIKSMEISTCGRVAIRLYFV